MSRRGLLAFFLLLGACQRSSSEPAAAAPVPCTAQATAPGKPPDEVAPPEPVAASPLEAGPVGDSPAPVVPLAICRAEGISPLEAARRYYDEGHFEAALSCAAQSAALEPDLADAHAERGMALAELGRIPEAQMAFARALAIDPGGREALLGAAHLYVVQLPSTRERDELGLLYSERGLSQPGMPPDVVVQFALLSAMAFNDLGQAGDALERAAIVLARDPGNHEAAFERALALFELCRFAEAKAAFTALLKYPDREAHAHQRLGLLLEREGKWTQAQHHFDKARALAPQDFPPPPLPSQEEFRAAVARAVEALPEDMRKDLEGIPVTAEEIPADADLMSGEPPLSPSILGLFRGPPLGEPCDGSETPCRSVALYRRNLARVVSSNAELLEQIQVTLLHEVGHLRGEDDEELAARGLE
ncbi:metallopeptidase family protein [Stigmatella aurantiaca]|uniref:Tetratricopeptide repeat domain protein n=1 Tax=Stigmatella aurantiaca (strain DW4/3-1) TaxID=378806 RepID=Q08VI2_STIAD|nr:metallopeptidase family protein [Stigmatella aurantiaca]ADO70599.1 Tetratricopeptide repeat protein [Stigmatella aurantiaca DW4/3-1]EAU64496.1 tetratricopeptide repeat domain protein [Stigmatella aurantiaca DW4/3-1]